MRFNRGIGTFSEALDAERAQFEAEDLLVERREKTAIAMVAVFKTLGAGFGRSRKAQKDENAASRSSGSHHHRNFDYRQRRGACEPNLLVGSSKPEVVKKRRCHGM
jgi:hypothetical protein